MPSRVAHLPAFLRVRLGPIAAAAMVAGAGPLSAHPYRLDPTHTTVHWEVLHMGTSTSRGRFDTLGGRAAYEPGRRLDVEVQVEMATVSTGIRAFDGMLRGASLLAAAEHPQGRFVSREVRWADDGFAPSEVRGDLTLRGVTRPLVLHAVRWRCGNNPLFGREVCGGDFTATLSRREFGMGFASALADDTVRLLIQVEAVREEAAASPGSSRGGER